MKIKKKEIIILVLFIIVVSAGASSLSLIGEGNLSSQKDAE